MLVVGVLFWVTGFFCSWSFPDIQNGSITAYLSEEFPDSLWFKVINTMVIFAVFLTFPLQVTPALEVLGEWCQPNTSSVAPGNSASHPNPNDDTPTGSPIRQDALLESYNNVNGGVGDYRDRFGWLIPRYGIVLGCAILVLLIDDLGLLMALFGAIGQTGLAMMPCFCHLALQRRGVAPEHRSKTLMDLVTIVFCTLVMLFGVIASVRRILSRN
jgi:Transmembrane amino acid transporter protein